MKPKLLIILLPIVCLAIPAYGQYTDSVWVTGGGGSPGDLIPVDVYLQYEGGGVTDSMSEFDILLTWDAAVCSVESYQMAQEFIDANWADYTGIDNQGTSGPPAKPKMNLTMIITAPSFILIPRGTHLAATVNFRILDTATPGDCSYIDSLMVAFSPPIYWGLVDKGGIKTYEPAYGGDYVCAVRAINWMFSPEICDQQFGEGTNFDSVVVKAVDNAGQSVTISFLGSAPDIATDVFEPDPAADSGFYSWATGPGDAGEYDLMFEAITEDQQLFDTLTCHISILAAAPYTLEFKKVLAWPGQQHILVPVWITATTLLAPDPVGGWEVLVDFDPTAVQVVDVVYHDFMIERAIDCDGIEHVDVPSLFHKPGYYPEFFDFDIGVAGHSNWVKVVGIMDMEWPQEYTPPIDTVQMPLFALVVDVNPVWDGQEAYFTFRFTGCGDNILSDPTGYKIYGPLDEDRPSWLDYCTYDPKVSLRDGADGCAGLGIQSVLIGDLNCNTMPCDVGDAIVFVNYLMNGKDALCDVVPGDPCFDKYGGDCAEMQAKASDVNGDGFYWTIADLVTLLNCINDNGGSVPPPSDEIIELTVAGSDVELTSDVDVGAAYFIMKYKGEIGEPQLRVGDMDLAWSTDNGVLKILVYSLESNPIAAGTHTLFTVPGAKKLVIDEVDIADAGGAQLGTRITVAPKTFVLYQNRPNPVNTTTDIVYAIPTDSKVSLKIYDAAGMLVETLVNEWKHKGFHTVTWDAKDVASGVYFYKLEAGKYSATRKLIRMK